METRAQRRALARSAAISKNRKDARESQWIRPALIAIALAAAIGGLHNQFAQDDLSIIVDSDRLHGLSNWGAILTQPYWPLPATPDLYRPFTSFILALQYAAGDGAPSVFRIVSYALYCWCSLAVFSLSRLVASPKIAFAVAALFAVHPVHVEAVALGVTQNELIVAILVCAGTTRYVRRRRAGQLSGADWAFLCGCFVVCAFSKEQGFLFPLFLLTAEFLLVNRPRLADRVRELWEGYGFLFGIALLAFAARMGVLHGKVGPTMIAEALRGRTVGQRTLTMLSIVPEWARLLLWPMHLRADYAPQEFVASAGFGLKEAFGAMMLAGLLVAIVWSWRRLPGLALGLCWAAIAILPVTNVLVPTGVFIAERTLLLPSVGALVAAGVSGAALLRWSIRRWPSTATSARQGAWAALGVLTMLGTVRSFRRESVWRDNRALTEASIVDSPRSWHAHEAVGEMLFDDGKPLEGVGAFQSAIALSPEPWRVRNRFAQRLRLIRADSAALGELEHSARDHPEAIETHAQMVPALIAVGRYDRARQLADSIILLNGGPQVMLWLRRIADSAAHAHAPPGSIRIGLGER